MSIDERKGNQSGAKPKNQQKAAAKLKSRDKICVQRRRGYTEVGEESDHFPDIGQLAPTRLHELPSPIQPHREQKWRLQARRYANQQAIVVLSSCCH